MGRSGSIHRLADLLLGRPLDYGHRSRGADEPNGLITLTDVQEKHCIVSTLCGEETVRTVEEYVANERVILM